MSESVSEPLLRPDCGSTGSGAPLPSGQCALVYVLTFVSAIGGFLFGYDTGVVSGAMVLVRADFHLSDEWHELIVSGTVGSAWLLSLAAGPLSDRIGRRPVVLAASAVFLGGALLAGLSPSPAVLLAGRLVLGVGIGLASSTVPVFIAEAAPVEARGLLTTVNCLFITGGQLAAALLCGALSATTHGWRWMLAAAALPAAVQLLGLLALPESPRYLLGRGRRREAAAALVRLRPPGFPVSAELEQIGTQCASEARRRPDAGCLLSEMMSRPPVRRALLVGCSLQLFQQLAGINTVMYYSASIIQLAGVRDVSLAIWLAALTAAVNFGGTLVGLALVERLGRRPLTLASMLGTVGALLLLASGFWLNLIRSPAVVLPPPTPLCDRLSCASCHSAGCGFCFHPTADGAANGSCLPFAAPGNSSSADGGCAEPGFVWAPDWCPAPYAWITVLGLCLYLVCFAPGMGPMPWTINAEIYPPWARGTGSGLAASCNWLANLAVSLTFLTLVRLLGRPGVFVLYAALAAVGLLVFCLWLPETRGVPLEAMARLFGGDCDDPPLSEERDDDSDDLLQQDPSESPTDDRTDG